MNANSKYLLLIPLCLSICNKSIGNIQAHDTVEIGKQIGDYTFEKIHFSPTPRKSIKGYQGKWLFLEFWYPGCSSGVKSLEKLGSLQKALASEMNFLLVCSNNKEYGNVEEIYGKLNAHFNVDAPVAYDSLLHVKWDIWAMPYIILVNPYGIVTHITNGQDVDAGKLKDLIEGRPVKFNPGVQSSGDDFKISKFPGSNNNSLMFRSILVKWKGERGMVSDLNEYVKWPSENRRHGIVATGHHLATLYSLAYLGRTISNVEKIGDDLFYPYPVLDLDNRIDFEYDTTYQSNAGLYNYNLAVPTTRSGDVNYLKQVFQSDLQRFFGYNVHVEKRTMPVWTITSDSSAKRKLQTKGGKALIDATPVGVVLRNVPMKRLCNIVVHHLSNRKRIFVNENQTGIEGNIDIEIDAILSDLKGMSSALKKYGLKIEQTSIEVNILVISDKSSN